MSGAVVVPIEARALAERRQQENGHAPQVNGAELLDQVSAFTGRFIAYPSPHARIAHTLWIAHAHLMDVWESTPRIAFLSPEPGSGKTRALEVSELLVPLAVENMNASAAYLFRKIADQDGRPTILFDEIDTIFGAKAKEHEDVRGILNAGHRKGAKAGRCVVRGKSIETEELPAYCAVAIAGLGMLPDTILTRSVVIKMRRRAPDEVVEPFRRREQEHTGHQLRDQLASWALSVEPSLVGVWPVMPATITDRAADVWEALLAVADAAGGEWPKLARESAVSFVSDSGGLQASLGVRLLTDLKAVFGTQDVLSTNHILEALIAMEESPWGDLKGKPLDARRLANYLRPYDVHRKQVRIVDKTVKGYAREDLHDPWIRYVGQPPKGSETSETSEPELPFAKSANGVGVEAF